MKKLHILTLAIAALLGAPVVSFAHHWTAACSTGAIDDADIDQYSVFASRLEFASGQTGTIQARYNVTNTSTNVSIPPWTTLELGYLDTSAFSSVSATLWKATPCTGSGVTAIAVVNSTNSPTAQCSIDALSEAVDLAANVYFVTVTITRTNTTVSPAAYTLRLY